MKPKTKFLYNDEYYTADELASMCGISPKTMYKRLQTMTPKDAVEYVAPVKNIKRAKKFNYKGKFVTVRQFCELTSMEIKTVYKKIKNGMSLEEIENYERPKTNNVVEKKYIYKDKLMTVHAVASLENIDSSNLYRRLNEGLDIESAVEIIKRNQTKYFPYMGKLMTIPEIAKTDSSISSYKLYSMLCGNEEYSEDDINYIVTMCGKNDIFRVGKQSLYQYCIDNKLNYTSIYYLIKYKEMSIKEAIDYYIENGQGKNISGKYYWEMIELNLKKDIK